jgi:hypothetical protein
MKTILLFVFVVLAGCNEGEEEKIAALVQQHCAKWNAQACRKCKPEVVDELRECYYDSRRHVSPKVVREDCLAVHVGKRCQPCESIFALNFGGALTEVSCKEFFTSIEERNSICDNCVKLSTSLR